MAKTEDKDPLAEKLNEIVKSIEQDRTRLSDYLDTLISTVKTIASEEDGKMIVVSSADSIAKIGDSLMKNNQLRATVVKSIVDRLSADEEKEDDLDSNKVAREIGGPFKPIVEDGN